MKPKLQLAFALAGTLPHLVDASAALPLSIQWMPPGRRNIIVRGKDGEPKEIEVNVDAAAAQRVQAMFVEMTKASTRGDGDLPYFDFNHDDEEASAHPTDFFWAGDDPATGGIHARLTWTDAGEAAIRGRRYRRFSPSFYRNEETGDIMGAPTNMGGLVNRAAFTTIQALWAKEVQNQPGGLPGKTETTNTNMKGLLVFLAKLGYVTAAEVDEATAMAQVQAKHNEISLKLTELETVKTKNGELQTQLTASNTKYDTLLATQAESAVTAAVTAGKIPAQNTELKAKWVENYKRDPQGTQSILDSLQASGALETVIQPGAGGGAVTTVAKGAEPEYLTKAKAWAKGAGFTGNQHDTVMAFFDANPAEYDKYRASNGLGKPQQS